MSKFSADEFTSFFLKILGLVQQSADRNEPLALAIVGNYRNPEDREEVVNFQHVQGNDEAIISSIIALIRGTFEHYKDNADFQKAFRLAILKITDKYFMTESVEDSPHADLTPQITEILSGVNKAMKTGTHACRVIASGIDNLDGTIRVQQVCEGQAGPLAIAIADIVTEFVRENRDSGMFLQMFQREVNRAFEIPVPVPTTPN